LQDEVVKANTLQKSLTESELRLQVRQVYYELQQKKELRRLYQRLAQTYSNYYEMAKVRVDVGATNAIETLTIQSAMNEYKLLERQADMEIATLEQRLKVLLNTDENVTTTDGLQMLPYARQDGFNTLRVQLAQQDVQMERALIPVVKSSMKPGFNVGYAAQNYFDGGWLSGLQAGVQIPLFNGATKKRVEAQQMQSEVANARYEAERLNADQQVLSIDNSIRLYAEGAGYYRDQLGSINPEIERISELNYQAGEISYLELLNTLNLLASNNKSYWDQVLAHNKAVALYQFLSNQ
jgi:cobalt-zinc-cadmium resistance protein CzcA